MEKLPLYNKSDSVNCYSYRESLEILECVIMDLWYEEATDGFVYKLQVQDSFNYPIIFRTETELL